MIVSRVNTKDFYRQLHDAIYGPVDRMKGVKRQLENPSDWLKQKVQLPPNQKHEGYLKKACRVALMYGYYHRFLYDLEERGCGCPQF